MEPASAAWDVVLRDGSTLRLRSPRPSDVDALVRFLGDLSERSRYLRFHGTSKPRAALVVPYVDPDWDERGALVGTLVDADGVERVVALGSFARLRDPAAAEVAFAVEDALQARGVGTRLLERLAELARARGVERFVAEVLPGNAAMLRMFDDAGFATRRHEADGVVEVELAIGATERYQALVDERDHVAVRASLRSFFEPSAVAVVGASRRRGTIGGELFRNVLAGDFTGAAYPVNPAGGSVAGVAAYRSVVDVPAQVDLAVVCVPGAAVLDAVDDALAAGVRALCVVSAGFGETGADGAARQEELLARVRARGARLIGPNCLGLAVSDVRLNATFAPRAFPPGRCAVSSQSGALGLALLERADARGLGVSAFVSVGNKADVSTNDLLEHWEDDPASDVVLLYVESFGNPRRFSRIARRAARRKPILALKGGTTAAGARAAASHTAALAGSQAAAEALFRQAGVLRAQTIEELLDGAVVLSTQPLPGGPRTAILTNAGGLGIVCADACADAGLELAALRPETEDALRAVLPAEASVANPVDMLGSATAETFAAAVPPVLADPGVDALIVLFVPPVVATPDAVARAIAASVGASDKPVLASIISARDVRAELATGPRPVAHFAYPEAAARALGLAAERAAWLRRPNGAVPELDGVDLAAARALVAAALDGVEDAWLDPVATYDLLAALGLAVVPQRVAGSVDEAVAAARELGLPAVVKTARPGVHKTDTGGVALGLVDEAAVRAAAERIGAPLLVQPMAAGGVELLAGLVQDPVFGPLVAFGAGGVLAELVGQAAFRLAPLTDVDAAALLETGPAGRLVAGFRGAPACDADALADVLHRLSRLGIDLPEVAELDLNPVLARPDGVTIVDARIRVRQPPARPSAKTW